MLSYVIPVEDKSQTVVNKSHLQLNLETAQQKPPQAVRNGSANGIAKRKAMAPTAIHNIINIEQTHGGVVNGNAKKIIKTSGKVNYSGHTISTDSSASSLSSKASDATSGATPTGTEKLKPKLVQNGATKTTSLKRVSFGSSKGSMVETLIYETPFQEELEVSTPTFNVPPESYQQGTDSKKVRVSFFESERPLVVNSPESTDIIFDILDAPNVMTSISPNGMHMPHYQRQNSTDSGWDNPFRPDGDLSREADEIVGLIKEGKPITPTSINGTVKTDFDDRDGVISAQKRTQLSSSPPAASSTPQKGTNGRAGAGTGQVPGVVDVQRTIVAPSSGGDVEPVVIKKKPKCKCCVIQ